MKDVGGAVLAGSSPPFLGRERAAVDVDVGPERRSPRYHETGLALESVKESSVAVSKPRGVWLRMPIVKNLEEVRVSRCAWRNSRSAARIFCMMRIFFVLRMMMMSGCLMFDDVYRLTLLDDCLLYTSPSPRDLSTSRMPSSA